MNAFHGGNVVVAVSEFDGSPVAQNRFHFGESFFLGFPECPRTFKPGDCRHKTVWILDWFNSGVRDSSLCPLVDQLLERISLSSDGSEIGLAQNNLHGELYTPQSGIWPGNFNRNAVGCHHPINAVTGGR